MSIGEKGLTDHLAAFDLALSLTNIKTMVAPEHSALSSVESGNIMLNKQDETLKALACLISNAEGQQLIKY